MALSITGRRARTMAILGIAMAVSATPAVAEAPYLQGERMAREGRVIGEKPDETSTNVSGMACRQPDTLNDPLDCLLIDDQRSAAQRVRIDGHRMMVLDQHVPLLGATAPGREAAGRAPRLTTCPGGERAFRDLDGEGVAFAPSDDGGHFYVTGSHGCGRSNGRFRASSFLIARVPVDRRGVLGLPVLSWRLTDALFAAPVLAPFVGRSVNEANGLNIEGLAFSGGELQVGFRAPTRDGTAFVMSIGAAALFAMEGADPTGVVFALPLGNDVGIRDLATLPNGELLVLAGPAQQQDVGYRLVAARLHRPAPGAAQPIRVPIRELGRLRIAGSEVKAEGVTVLGERNGALQVLITFDGVENGGPYLFSIADWRQLDRR